MTACSREIQDWGSPWADNFNTFKQFLQISKDTGKTTSHWATPLRALRLERGYGVCLSFVQGTLYITGGDRRRRQDALKDVVENLPIVLDCPFLPLEDHKRISDSLLNRLNFEYNVAICRPSTHNKTGTISGRIDRCKTVYHLLKKASSSSPG